MNTQLPNERETSSKLIRYAHFAVILIGAAVYLAGCFQNSIWFDEAYTVGLLQQNFFRMIWVSVFDVHPPLYYMMLKIFTLIFGSSLPVMRIFSAIGAILFCLLGYTHIRRDYGEKLGFWFSFFAVTFTSISAYACQIRMYTWAMLFVALAAFYGFRVSRNPNKRDTLFFILSSLAAAYTHHFAFFTVCAINIFLLVRWRKDDRPMKDWFRLAAFQIVPYLPGAAILFCQTFLSWGGGWRTIGWPSFPIDVASYHLLADPLWDEIGWYNEPLYAGIGFGFIVLFSILVVLWTVRIRARVGAHEAALAAAKVHLGVIGFSLFVSIFSVLYYNRYTTVLYGLVVFLYAYLMATEKKAWVKIVAVALSVGIFAWQSVYLWGLMYDPSADAVTEYLDAELQEGDVFLTDDFHDTCVTVRYPDHRSIYYHGYEWNGSAYVAFDTHTEIIWHDSDDDAENLRSCEFLNAYKGRLWVIDRGACSDYVESIGFTEVQTKTIHTRYHNQTFEFVLYER